MGKKVFKDFKDFAMKGSVVDLAVGVIIGSAFGKIVTSLVNDIIMPVIGLLIGKVDFTNLFFSLDGKEYPSLALAKEVGAPTFNYGLFINTVIEFLIISFSIFMVIKFITNFRKREDKQEGDVKTKNCPFCYSEIHKSATKCPNCTSQI